MLREENKRENDIFTPLLVHLQTIILPTSYVGSTIRAFWSNQAHNMLQRNNFPLRLKEWRNIPALFKIIVWSAVNVNNGYTTDQYWATKNLITFLIDNRDASKNTHTLSLSLSHTHTHKHNHMTSLSLSLYTQTHTKSVSHNTQISLSPSFLHTHTHTHTHTYTLSLSLSLTHTCVCECFPALFSLQFSKSPYTYILCNVIFMRDRIIAGVWRHFIFIAAAAK